MTTKSADALRARYEALPYPPLVHPWSHPRRTGVIARLLGFEAAAVATCRVLELGCGTGTNLVSIAADHPELEAVGVDLSPRQIDEGRALCQALGLGNVELVVGDALDLPAERGEFDYIICHGVLSWVPPEVQRRFLALIGRHLAPRGVAYLSYNTLPGWRFGQLTRDLFLRGTSADLEPGARVRAGRELLAAYLAVMDPKSPIGAALAVEAKLLERTPDEVVWHDIFAPEQHPLWVEDLVAGARACGLDYLANARPEDVVPETERPEVWGLVSAEPDRVRQQHVLDWLGGERFRHTLLCRSGHELGLRLGAEVLLPLHVSLREGYRILARGVNEVVVKRPDGESLEAEGPGLASALEPVMRVAPGSVPATAVLPGDAAAADELASYLTRFFLFGVLDLSQVPLTATGRLSERPAASALARAQAERGPLVTNRLHTTWNLEPREHALLKLVDGTRDVPALATSLGIAESAVRARLRTLADRALLIA